MAKKPSNYTLHQLEDQADFYGLRMHRGDKAVALWLRAIHDAANKRMLQDDKAYKRHCDAVREQQRGAA
ncbi:hypothetical protein [Nocardia spumae]|uniref:hypothetical protein n=1 Tax=Nocardia spumae TaxID=2887190 RepID=UPI001D13577A|nr:hypothetical protein [Nocardia spumae]